MLLTLMLPRIGEYMRTAVIRTVHADVGAAMTAGSKIVDVVVDLSSVAAQDCPPVAMYRIALTERCVLRELAVAPGDEIAVGALVARFTTEPRESLAGPPARAVRVAVAGIVDPSEWWDGPGA
jgi:pyruvate/2-oxoglutarate dehydrogenase complex dihydrolipoamide acyltransferase (E2) component